MSYTLSSEGAQYIKDNEGCRLTAYPDGVSGWDIGYGCNSTSGYTFNGRPVGPGLTITQAQADQAFTSQSADAANCLAGACPNPPAPLTQPQIDGLTDYIYQDGCTNFKNSGIPQAVNSGDIAQAATIMSTTPVT